MVVLNTILLCCFAIALAVSTVFHEPIFFWIETKQRRRSLKKTIHKVKVETDADLMALAYGLAVSDVETKDLVFAASIHPVIKRRFSKRGRRRIAEEAFLLRKDEHHSMISHPKWLRVIIQDNRRNRLLNQPMVFSVPRTTEVGTEVNKETTAKSCRKHLHSLASHGKKTL